MRNGRNKFEYTAEVILAITFIIFVSMALFIPKIFIKQDKISNSNIIQVTTNYTITPGTVKAELYTLKPQMSSSQIAKAFSDSKAIVMGDSTVEGLEAYGILNDINCVWTRGRSVLYMTADLPEVISYKPNKLFLSYGTNDMEIWQGNSQGFINKYKEAIEYIKKELPNTTIYINSILPTNSTILESRPDFKYVPEFNTALVEMCNKLNITFIDNTNILLENDQERKFESDGIHPRPFFYKGWAQNMIDKAKM